MLHIEKELVESKVGILRGRGSKNNELMLKTLALEGPLIKYDLFKALKESGKNTLYPTISRRIDDLVDRGYLSGVGTKTIVVGKRKDKSSTYGLTWQGLIGSLTVEEVAEDVIKVLENNPHLKLPFPREVTLRIVKEIFTKEELKIISKAFLTGYLKAIPKDLESLRPEQLFMYLFPAITEAPKIQEEFEKKDFSRLLEIQEVFIFFTGLLEEAEKMYEEALSSIREVKKLLNAKKNLRIKEYKGRDIQ